MGYTVGKGIQLIRLFMGCINRVFVDRVCDHLSASQYLTTPSLPAVNKKR